MTRRRDLDTGDHELMKTRVCSRQCSTCIFTPGGPLDGERIARRALSAGAWHVCHHTHPPIGPAGAAAVCRGFYTRYRGEGALLIAGALWGFVFIDPPGEGPEESCPIRE